MLALGFGAQATTVQFNLVSITGSSANRQITLTLATQGAGVAVLTNIAFNTPKKLQPIGGTVTTNLVPANYWVAIDTVPTPMFMPVPDSTNVYNAIDLITQGLRHLVPPVTNWFSIEGALLYDPLVATVAQGTATNLFSYWHLATTNTNWKFYTGDGYTPSILSWTHGLDFSGMAAGALNAANPDIALITPMHGITAAHAWAGSVGSRVIFYGTNGLYTNYVAAYTNPISDIELVTFSNAAPVTAGVNPFWLLPTNATSYLPTDFSGMNVVWFRNNPGIPGAPHMNLQAVTFGPPIIVGTGVADPAIPFYEGNATSGDSGGPVFTVLQGAGVMRPVFLYSIWQPSVAGPWVSWPAYWSVIQPLLGTNQASFVDLSQYQTVAPIIPADGTVNAHAAGLPVALTIAPLDEIVINKRPSPGQPVTERITASNFLQSIQGFANWPPGNGGTNGGGVDIRPLNNTFTGQNTFNAYASFGSRLDSNGTNEFFGPTWALGYLYSQGLHAGLDASVASDALWFSDNPGAATPHSYGLISVPRVAGQPGSFYFGSNIDGILLGGPQPGSPAQIQDGNFLGGGGGLINLNASQLATGTVPDARLSWNETKMGNVFNGVSQLVQLNGSGQLPALDGSLLTALNASQLSSGTVPAARMPAFTGDITTSAGSTATTLKNTGTLGTYTKVTFDAQGRETSGTTLSAGDIPAIPESGVTSLVSDLASKIANLGGLGTNLTVHRSLSVTNSTYGDLLFFDSTNHAFGFIQTNGTYWAWTNGIIYENGATNNDWLVNLIVTGNTLMQGTETNSTITGPGLIGIDVNGKRSAVTVGSGLLLSSGNLTATGGDGTGIGTLNGFGTNTTFYGVTTFGTNANAGMLTIDGLGNITLFSTNGYLFQAKDTGSNTFFSLHGTNQQINVRGLIQIPTNGLSVGGITDVGPGNINASNTVSALGITNRQFAAIGVMTNDANGKEYTTPTLPFTLTSGSSANLAGALTDETGSGLATFSGNPTLTNLIAKGDQYGTNALFIDKNGVVMSNNISQVVVSNGAIYASGTASAANVTNRSFSAIGVQTNDANGKEYTTPTLPSTLIGSGLALYGGSSGPITLPVSGTYWMAPNNSFTNAAADASAVTRCTIPANGTLANLYVTASASPGAVNNTVTIMTNGVSTGITVTLNATTTANDTTHTAPVLAGYEVGIKVVTLAGTAVKWGWGFQLK